MRNQDTIQVQLTNYGEIRLISAPVKLYKDSYKVVKISCIVPKVEGNVLVKIYGSSPSQSGENVWSTQTYSLPYKEEVVIENQPYQVYEDFMPQEFCLKKGDITITFAQVKIVSEEVEQNITSGKVNFFIGGEGYDYNGVKISDYDNVASKVNENAKNIATNTANIKGLDERVTQNRADINSNDEELLSHNERLEVLEQREITGITFIGTYPSQATFPTSAELDAFVKANTKPSREPRAGDNIRFTKIIPNETDINYTIYYGEGGWGKWGEIPLPEKADNKTFGIQRGTNRPDYNDPKGLRIDVINGEPRDVLTRTNNDNYISLAPRLNEFDIMHSDIISGRQKVGFAEKSIGDENGLNIVQNYALEKDHYNKAYIDQNFLPSTYTNTYHYSKDGLVDDIPTTPLDEKQFEIISNSVGEHNIFKIFRQVTANYNFNKNTTDQSDIWLMADRDCVANFRLTTRGEKKGVKKLLSAELTGDVNLTANTLKLIKITSLYSYLGNEEYNLLKADGDKIWKELDVITTYSTATTFGMYCGETHDSTYRLAKEDKSNDINFVGGASTVDIRENDWVDNGDGTFKVSITPAQHKQTVNNKYVLDLQYRKSANSVQRINFSPEISDDGVITLHTYDKLDCQLLIWSEIKESEKTIKRLTNPQAITDVDYTQVGAITIIQTEKPPELTLPLPKNVSQYYTCFVSDDKTSTHDIHIEGNTVKKGNGLKFKWNGNEWQIDEMPDKTSEITDDLNNQPLNTTLQDLNTQITNNYDEVNMVAGDLADLTLEVDKKTNSKSVEMKEGLPEVTNLVEYYKYFYDLRKGNNRTFVVEVDENKNADLMEILGGFPESTNKKGSVLIEIPSTDGVGYPIRNTFISENNTTVYTNYVRGWIISGTSYDNKIHLTKWVNQNDLSNKVSQVAEQEKVYATDGLGNQTTLQYNVEPYGDGLARRTSNGRLKVSDATEDNDAVSKKQLDGKQNTLTAGNRITISQTNEISYSVTPTLILTISGNNLGAKSKTPSGAYKTLGFTDIISFANTQNVALVLGKEYRLSLFNSLYKTFSMNFTKKPTFITGETFFSGFDASYTSNEATPLLVHIQEEAGSNRIEKIDLITKKEFDFGNITSIYIEEL